MTVPFDFSQLIDQSLRQAASQTEGFDDTFDPGIRPAEPRFGDFQANGVLPFAKQKKTNPRQLATALVESLASVESFPSDAISVEIAGPGFLNFRLSPALLLEWLKHFSTESDLQAGAGDLLKGKNAIVDYPSPNTAKQMHIGHLRPMVIGEAIKRMLKFAGANVIQDDHLGDWGTNFGTLIMAIKREGYDLDATADNALAEIERLYKSGTALEKEAPSIRDQSRAELVKLQQGDAENTEIWNKIVAISNNEFSRIYKILDVKPDITLGESFYRDKVDRIYAELQECELAEESDGALVVFHPDHPRFAKQPFIIRKSDGASNYASTDLATMIHRVEENTADMIAYFTDGRQQDHFQQLFLTAEKWFSRKGYPLPKLEHVWWGTILGEDGKAIKTKSGAPIYLRALLDEAQERAYAIVNEKNPELAEDEKRSIASAVGIGAVRYADLSQNRTQDYTFSWDKLLAFEGNSAPYLLYAAARIYSILAKGGVSKTDLTEVTKLASSLETDAELGLARKLALFPMALEQALADLRPHFICTYLYELTGTYSTFNNADKVLVDDPEVKARRLLLCARTLLVLETGLHMLGLETVERM
ncbi:arginine--tRNA ligase [Rubellicoccus peritrichatus]|uniref:Arginine--tRNA ligase n=1 Tax=Rubellicoccus peritrichatus TaxID=3080537 RepID=A0AAQ3L6C2_9BACT|nr:arginine--tRNA ligase [Puniceicoccus sp. CR14]WOO40115.1 arginine--tRNA ligase [Puniceicoccus sp. CR14]